MSTFNELGERGLNAVLQARANMVGSAPSPSMMPEIGPTLALEVDRPEWGYWKNEFYFATRESLPNLAGEHAGFWIQPRPGYVHVITRITNQQSVQMLVGWRTPLPVWTLAPAPPALYRPFQTDNRAPINAPFQMIGGYGTPANTAFDTGSGGAGAVLYTLGTGNTFTTAPIVLRSGGRNLWIRTGAVNTTIVFAIEGYTRPENPNEQLG